MVSTTPMPLHTLCMTTIMIVLLSIYVVVVGAKDDDVHDDIIITCGSVIKLQSLSPEDNDDDDTHNYLRSSGISWGSGAGQQIVTVRKVNNGNRDISNDVYWLIEGGVDDKDDDYDDHDECLSGHNIQCGSSIRLKHVSTGKYLHSHRDPSNLSGQQEVTGYDGHDDWVVECKESGRNHHQYWLYTTTTTKSSSSIALRHKATGKYLTSSIKYQYHEGNCPGCPIIGDREVACGNTKEYIWVVDGGAIISISQEEGRDYHITNDDGNGTIHLADDNDEL